MAKELDKDTLDILINKGIISLKDIEKLNEENNFNGKDLKIVNSVNRFVLSLKEEYSSNTLSAYKSTIESFFQYLLNVEEYSQIKHSELIPDITIKDIGEWFGYLIANGYSPSSIRRSKHGLKNYFNYISNYGFNSPYISNIEIPNEENIEINALRDDEVRGITEYAVNLRDKTIILFMYETGMRRNEVIDCKKEHVSFENDRVEIYKSGIFDRVGYFSKETSKLLKDYLEEWEMEVKEINDKRFKRHLLKNENYLELKVSEYLFQTSRSEKINYTTIFKALKKMAYEFFYNREIQSGTPKKDAEEVATYRADDVNTEILRNSRRAYYFATGKNTEQVQVLMGDENKWVCNRFQKISQKLYPEKFI